jgi:ATP-dependent DNA ligase
MSIERMRESWPPSGPTSLSLACRPPPTSLSSSKWIHEIKHDGYRLMARRDPVGIRLITRNGHDWAARYHWWSRA